MRVELLNNGYGTATIGGQELKTREKLEVEVTPEEFELLRATGAPLDIRVRRAKEKRHGRIRGQ